MTESIKKNLELWRAVERTDPASTKPFKGKGGFSGTAISPMWLIKQATEQWGPMGGRWGIRIIADHVVDGAPLILAGNVVGRASIHIVQAEVYYPLPDGTGQGSIPCFGQTEFCGQRKSGDFFTDEEAPKKSLTDALTKGLSWLGFAADVHMGRFDDVKYVNQIGQEFAEAARTEHSNGQRAKALAVLEPAATNGYAAFSLAWKGLSEDARKALSQDDVKRLKKITEEATPAA